MSNTVAFDPGYGQYLTSFINTIEYMYGEINKFLISKLKLSNVFFSV